MRSKSIKGNSPEELEVALHDATTDGFLPTLAIIFLSVKQNRQSVCSLFNRAGIAIYGSTSHGEFINEDLQKESVVVLLLDIRKEYFKIYFDEYPAKNRQ